MQPLNQQIRELQNLILALKLESPYHPDIKALQQQIDDIYARQSSEQA